MKFLLVILCAQIAGSSANNIPLFALPSVDFADLTVLDQLAVSTVANSLTTVGALQITGIPHFRAARTQALQPAAACLKADLAAPSVQMGDNKHRVSSAALSVNGVPGTMSGDCGVAADSLRATVDGAVFQLLNAMDKYSSAYKNNDKRKTPEFVMEPYRRYSDIYQHGEHLEHLHAFFNADKSSALSQASAPTLDFHTDAGLFIAMTTGLYTSAAGDHLAEESNGLYLQLMSGSVVEVLTNEDALIVMVGDGGARWLAPLLGSSLRAAPHSLRVASSTQHAHSRAWFGKMFLPPADALLPARLGNSQEAGAAEVVQLRYDKYRQLERQHVSAVDPAADASAAAHPPSLPSACGHTMPLATSHGMTAAAADTSASYSHLVGNELCGGASDGTGVLCWTQCMSVAGLSCGLQAECVDTATGLVVPGDIMCPSDHQNCELQCVEASNNDSSDLNGTDFYDKYCWGSGVTMYMSGFKSLSGSHQGRTECINLFFEEWTLDNKSVFAAACIGVFLLGMVIELLVLVRRLMFSKMPRSLLRDVLMVLLHGSNVVLSYFIMLVAMTYNVELFCMAVSGLTVGYMVFNLAEPPRHKTDPCCSLGHDEGDEKGAAMVAANPMYAADNTATVLQTVVFHVEGQGPMSVFADMQLLETTKAAVLAVAGVQRVDYEMDAGRIFEVTFNGDANLGNEISIRIGMYFGGLTVSHQDKIGVFIRVEDMTCGSCTETVRRAAARVQGVKFCLVDLKRELCGVVLPREGNCLDAVVTAIDDVGFDAKAVVVSRV